VKGDSAIRRLLLAVLLIGMAGALTDLLLLSHYEDTAQVIPLALLAAALAAVAWGITRPSIHSVRTLQAIMILFVVAGLIGVVLHFNGAAEFQREIDPSIAWWPLVTKVARSQSPPLLAPAAMVQLGLIGLVYTFRHPITGPADRDFNEVNR
jgi:hypothetical protein